MKRVNDILSWFFSKFPETNLKWFCYNLFSFRDVWIEFACTVGLRWIIFSNETRLLLFFEFLCAIFAVVYLILRLYFFMFFSCSVFHYMSPLYVMILTIEDIRISLWSIHHPPSLQSTLPLPWNTITLTIRLPYYK